MLTKAEIERKVREGKKSIQVAEGLILSINGQWETEDEIRGSWKVRYTWEGKTVTKSAGSADIFGRKKGRTPRQALTVAQDIQRMAAEGIDPKEAGKAAKKESAAKVTIGQLGLEHVENNSPVWGDENIAEWNRHLRDHILPKMGHIAPADYSHQELTDATTAMLKPVWMKQKESGERVMFKIRAIFEDAIAFGHIPGPNPVTAAIRKLPKRSRYQDTKKQPSLHWKEAPEFFASITDDNAACAPLRFLMLTGVRTSPVRFSQWDWLKDGATVWRVPAMYMKLRKLDKLKPENDHLVPVSSHMQNVLAGLDKSTEFMFPGERAAKINENAITDLCDRMHKTRLEECAKGWVDQETGDRIVGHGFRATFRTWVSDYKGPHYAAIAEMVLSHASRDKTIAAYDRSEMLKYRLELLEEWGDYLTGGNNWQEI